MVTVDMSIDSRSTDGRYLGRCIHRASVECRASVGRASAAIWSMYRPIIGLPSVERSTDSRSR